MIFKYCVWSFSNLSIRSIKRDIFGIFLAPLHLEDEQLIQRFERSVAVKTFYLGSISDFAGRAASAARVQNPRLCNPIKVTGFISPDLTFSAPEDFMTLPMPILLFSSHYQRHALQPFFFIEHFLDFKSWFSRVTRIGKFLECFMKYWFCSCMQVGRVNFDFFQTFYFFFYISKRIYKNSLKCL